MEINKRAPNRKDTGGLLCQLLLFNITLYLQQTCGV